MFNHRGSLVVALVIVVTFFYLQQGIPASQVSPVFVDAPSRESQFVELSGNLFICSGLQVVEVDSINDLLCRVDDTNGKLILLKYLTHHKLMDGHSVELNQDCSGRVTVESKFMTAGRRMTLGVALHPDRMTIEDWQSLPGIGASMARAITVNREQNGDFYTFENLRRVRGIAQKSLNRWQKYF